MSDKSLQNTIALSTATRLRVSSLCVYCHRAILCLSLSCTIRTHLDPIKGISGESRSTQGHTLEREFLTPDTPFWLKHLHPEQFLTKASLSGDTSTDHWNSAFHERFLIHIVTGNRRKIYPWVKEKQNRRCSELKELPRKFPSMVVYLLLIINIHTNVKRGRSCLLTVSPFYLFLLEEEN